MYVLHAAGVFMISNPIPRSAMIPIRSSFGLRSVSPVPRIMIIRFRRQRRFQVAGSQFLRGRRSPVANESIGGNDEMGANPVFSDSHAASLPGGDMVRIRGFPGELDDPLRWRVAGDYTRSGRLECAGLSKTGRTRCNAGLLPRAASRHMRPRIVERPPIPGSEHWQWPDGTHRVIRQVFSGE